MMTCDEVRARLPHHPDPDETPELREAVSNHLRACSGCAEAWRDLQAAWESLRAWEDAEARDDFLAQVRVRLHRQGARRRPLAWISRSAAAGLLLAIAAAFLALPARGPSDGLSPSEIEIIRNLDLLENLEMAQAVDVLETGATLDELAGVMDLMSIPDASGPETKEY